MTDDKLSDRIEDVLFEGVETTAEGHSIVLMANQILNLLPTERIGYLCLQHYPNRICSGCTSACCEPVYAYPKRDD